MHRFPAWRGTFASFRIPLVPFGHEVELAERAVRPLAHFQLIKFIGHVQRQMEPAHKRFCRFARPLQWTAIDRVDR